MSQHSELHLKSDHVLAVNTLDVATDQNSDPNVSVHPDSGKIDLGGGNPSATGEIDVRNKSGRSVATLGGNDEAGFLALSDKSGDEVIRLDASSSGTNEISVVDGTEVAASINNTTLGGSINVRNTMQSEMAVHARADPDGGRLQLSKLGGAFTCKMLGANAALLLEDDQVQGFDAAGGGELVIGNTGSSSAPKDLHVHASGKFTSEYGLPNNHRPRIYLNGPEATLELGRDQQSSGVEGVNGEVILRDDHGESLLELRATGSSTSEVVFRWTDGSTVEKRGTIRAEQNGLMIRDSNGDEALLITNNGEVRTRKQVTNTL